MAKRQKRLEGTSLVKTLPELIGKKINLIEKDGTAHWVEVAAIKDDLVKLYTMRNNAFKKDKMNLKIEDIAEIILDYPDDIEQEKNQAN